MSLESGSYISALDSVNPTGSDPKSRGDDHLRLIKSTLKNSFAGITGAVQVGGTNGGVANAYTLTPTPALVSYVTNMTIVFSPAVSNTGASTIDVSGLGAINLRSVSGAALLSGELASGQTYKAIFNGTEFRLDSITKNYADQLAFNTTLPAQTLGFLRSDGSTAAFTKKHTGYAQDEVKGSDIASAATVNLQTATGNLVHITGTTGITAFTLDSGAEREVVFDGILTITHNATTLILPGGANITTAAGDTATIRGDGVGNSRVVKYQKASGLPVVSQPSALVRIAGPVSVTAVAAIDFLTTFSSTYDNYLIAVDGIRPASTDTFIARLAIGGVASSLSAYYSGLVSGSAITSAATSASIAPTVLNTGGGLSALIYVNNVNDSARDKQILCNSAHQTNATPAFIAYAQHTQFNNASVITGIRFAWLGGGNFDASGTITIYGISKA